MGSVRRILLWGERHPAMLAVAFLLIVAGIGWIAHGGFGVSQDEPAVLKFGMDTLLYVFQNGPTPEVLDWKFYNPLVQEAFAAVMYLFGISAIHDVWSVTHYGMFLVFLGGLAAFLALAQRVTGSVWWAILGGIWLICSPRIFGHAFVNPKDIPALTLFTVSMLTLVRMLERPTWPRIVLHAFACAVSISVRSSGLLVPVITIGYFLAQALPLTTPSLQRAAIRSVIFLLSVAICTVLVWPALWSDPFAMLSGAILDNTSRGGGGLYMGTIVYELPWHYVPVWIGITTPVLYSILFLLGCARIARSLWRRSAADARVPLLALLWLIIPVASQIVLHIGIFDEWRHLLFVYPAFLLVALIGAVRTWNSVSGIGRIVVAVLLIVGTLSPAAWIVKHNGLNTVFFSIPGSVAAGNFEGDYWDLSYRQGIEWVLANDDRKHIVLYGFSRKLVDSATTFGEPERSRISVTDAQESADYLLDNYTSNGYQPTLPEKDLVHAITVDGMLVLGIYRGRGGDVGE